MTLKIGAKLIKSVYLLNGTDDWRNGQLHAVRVWTDLPERCGAHGSGRNWPIHLDAMDHIHLCVVSLWQYQRLDHHQGLSECDHDTEAVFTDQWIDFFFFCSSIPFKTSNHLHLYLNWFTASLADGIFQLAASFSGCNASLVGTFFSVAIAIHGLHTSCTYINPNDLSPNYASTISALMYALGASLSIFIPIIFARLAPNVSKWFALKTNKKYKQDQIFIANACVACSKQSLILEWRRIFWIIMGSQFVKILLFAVWGSAEIQPWNASSYQVITWGLIPEHPHGHQWPLKTANQNNRI